MSALAAAPDVPRGTVRMARLERVPLDLVDVAENVRVDPGELEELAASIRELGVLQPIRVVGPGPGGRYRAVWGQRRILASRLADQADIPAVVEAESEVDQPGAKRSIEQLVENLQRKDLNPIEEAVALREVLDADPAMTHDALAARLGRSRPWLSNTLSLLEAPASVQDLVRAQQLSASHVKALRGLAPKTQTALATEAVERGASAHGLEQLVQQHKRQEEWRQEQQQRSAEARAAAKARTQAGLDRLAKYKVALDEPIRVVRGHYGDAGQIADAVRALGYTDVKLVAMGDIFARTSATGCDCTAWKVEGKYDGVVTVSKACTNRSHVAAKDRLQAANDQARRKLGEDCRVALEQRILGESQGLPPMLARVVLWHALDWSVNDWLEEQRKASGNRRLDAWSALVALSERDLRYALAKYLSKRLTDQNGIKLDFDAIAEELGIAEPGAAPEAPAATRPAKAAPKISAKALAAARADLDLDGAD